MFAGIVTNRQKQTLFSCYVLGNPTAVCFEFNLLDHIRRQNYVTLNAVRSCDFPTKLSERDDVSYENRAMLLEIFRESD